MFAKLHGFCRFCLSLCWRPGSPRPTLDACFPASNGLSWLNSDLSRHFCLACRFLRFIASNACCNTCACCQTLVFSFAPCIARFPVVFYIGFLSPLHVACIVWFYLTFSPLFAFPFACRLALRGFIGVLFYRLHFALR